MQPFFKAQNASIWRKREPTHMRLSGTDQLTTQRQGKIVQSAGACAELCRDFGEKCQSFTWRPDKGNSCWLKNDWTFSNERTGDADSWSGRVIEVSVIMLFNFCAPAILIYACARWPKFGTISSLKTHCQGLGQRRTYPNSPNLSQTEFIE